MTSPSHSDAEFLRQPAKCRLGEHLELLERGRLDRAPGERIGKCRVGHGAVLGESRQAAKMRARLPVAPIAAADVDGRAAMGERRPDQRLEAKMTRTITVIIAAHAARPRWRSALRVARLRTVRACSAGKRSVATEFSAQSRPRACTRAHAHPSHAGRSGRHLPTGTYSTTYPVPYKYEYPGSRLSCANAPRGSRRKTAWPAPSSSRRCAAGGSPGVEGHFHSRTSTKCPAIAAAAAIAGDTRWVRPL